MGCYLSTPDENVYITEGRGKNYTYATASCQGWRKEQEDAEDCIPNFDGEDTSLFILCDGHGGAEVAKYTVQHLPEMIKNQPLYKKGDYGRALYFAFIEFDALLRKRETLDELYKMAMDEDHDRKDNQSETDGGADSGGDRPNSVDSSEPVAGSSSGFSDGPSSSNGRPSTVVDDVDADTLRREATEPLTEIFKQLAKRSGALFNPSPVVKSKSKKESADGVNNDEGGDEPDDKEPEPSSSTSGSAETSQGSSSQNIKSMKENLLAKVIQRYFANVNDEGDDDDSEYDGSDETESDEDDDDEDDDDEDEDDDEEDDDEEDDDDEEGDDEDISESDGAPGAKGDEDGDDEDEDYDVVDAFLYGRSKKLKFKKHHRPTLKQSKTSSDDDDEEYVDDEDEVVGDTSEDNEDEWDDNRPQERGEKRKRSPKDNGSDYEDEDDDEIGDDDCLLPKLTPAEREEYAQKLKRNYVADKDGLPRIKGHHRPGFDSGCTTIVALIKGNDIYVASVGDSRCILIKSKGSCVVMSYDHKPTSASEMTRIYGAGGRVNDGRVNGGLNLSRALGDFNYKAADLAPWRQMISPCPDVRVRKLDSVEYILMACDGIWNSMVNSQAARFIADLGPKLNHNLADLNVELFRKCIARGTDGDGTGCDNMTSILIRFDSFESEESHAPESNSARTSDERDKTTTTKQNEQNSNSDLNTTAPIAQESCSTGAPKTEPDEEMRDDETVAGGSSAEVAQSSSTEQSTAAIEKAKSPSTTTKTTTTTTTSTTTNKRRSVRSLDLKISHSSNIEST